MIHVTRVPESKKWLHTTVATRSITFEGEDVHHLEQALRRAAGNSPAGDRKFKAWLRQVSDMLKRTVTQEEVK